MPSIPDDAGTRQPFQGFYRQRYTQIPNDFLDDYMTRLKLGEIRALLYIMRRTFGFPGDDHAGRAISLQQMEHGLVIKGKQVDHGTGLAHATLLAALQSLEAKGYITTERVISPERGNEPTIYRLHLRAE